MNDLKKYMTLRLKELQAQYNSSDISELNKVAVFNRIQELNLIMLTVGMGSFYPHLEKS